MFQIITAILMGANGITYCVVGVCMLLPYTKRDSFFGLAHLYSSMFKTQAPHSLQDAPSSSSVNDPEKSQESTPENDGLWYRLLAYLLLLLGVCRAVTGFFWGCGYVYMGLGTCLAEIGIVAHELLRQESLLLNRAMIVLFDSVCLALLYISSAVPHCH